jgi:hypothetical protein
MDRREEILYRASELISGDRANDYGSAQKNFSNIATGWSVILGVDVKPHQVALCMDWLKTARLINQPTHEDSWTDKAGYTALGWEIISEKPDSNNLR